MVAVVGGFGLWVVGLGSGGRLGVVVCCCKSKRETLRENRENNEK